MKEKITVKNIIAYIQGHIRYELYYSKYRWLISRYKREQIKMRINSMNKECYIQGSCIKCGCRTTHLQMASKKCKGDCYPKMLSKKMWNKFKNNKYMNVDNILWKIKNNKFRKYE